MEKSTKNNIRDKCFGDHSEDEWSSHDSSDGDVIEHSDPGMYVGPFAIVDPIDTCLGPIGKFNLDEDVLPRHAAIGAFGKRRTGKTFWGRWLFYNSLRHIPFGVVFTNTTINGFWQKYVPRRYVFQGLPKFQMDRLIARQKRLIAQWKKDHPEETAKNPDAYKEAPELAAFCIFDDVIADRVAMQWSEDIATFFVEGRHLCVTVFITTQHVKGIGPMLRKNLDIVNIQPMFEREARTYLADQYGGFIDRNLFLKFMSEVVKDENLPGSTPQNPKKYVRTLVINDFENTTDPQIKFHYGESENPDDIEPNWRLCDDVYWKLQEEEPEFRPKGEPLDVVDYLDSVCE